jgi:hypothetical protein
LERLGMDEIFIDATEFVKSGLAGPSQNCQYSASAETDVTSWHHNASSHAAWCGHIESTAPSNTWKLQPCEKLEGRSRCSGGGCAYSQRLSPHVGSAAPPVLLGTPQYPTAHLEPHSAPNDSQPITCLSGIAGSAPLASGCRPMDLHSAPTASAGEAPAEASQHSRGSVNPQSKSVQETLQRLRTASWLAAALRARLRADLNITASAGIGCSKLAAKLASSQRKPNGQTTLLPWCTHTFLAALPLWSIPGVGHTFNSELCRRHMVLVQDARRFPRAALCSELGESMGSFLHDRVWGVDPSPIESSVAPKSISCEDAFQRCASIAEAGERMTGLIRSLLVLLDDDCAAFSRRPGVLRVSWRCASSRRQSKQSAFPPTVGLGGGAIPSPIERWQNLLHGSASRDVAYSPTDERGALLLHCGTETQVPNADERVHALLRCCKRLLLAGLASQTPPQRSSIKPAALHLTLLSVAVASFSNTPPKGAVGRDAGGGHSLSVESMLLRKSNKPAAASNPRGSAGRVRFQQQPSPSASCNGNAALQGMSGAALPNAAAAEIEARGLKRPRLDSIHYLGTAVTHSGTDANSGEGGGRCTKPEGVSSAAWDKLPEQVRARIVKAANQLKGSPL